MDILNSDKEGLFRSLSDSLPTHCRLNIESFSLLTEYHGVDGYESKTFEAGGYLWKLVLYPNGNKKKNVEDYISVYLRIVKKDTLRTDWGVSVDFRLFLLDQNKGRYLVLEDAYTKQKCIHAGMLDVGFDKLISLKEFTDVSNGYLIDDKCVFGAEVFVCEEIKTGQAEGISRLKSPNMYEHVWEIQNYSILPPPCHRSEPFTVEGQKWMIELYPEGHPRSGKHTHLSLYLGLADKQKTPVITGVYAKYTLRLNPNKNNAGYHGSGKGCFTTTSGEYGWHKFIPLSDLHHFVRDDTLRVEAEITVVGIAKEFPKAKDIVHTTGEGFFSFNSTALVHILVHRCHCNCNVNLLQVARLSNAMIMRV